MMSWLEWLDVQNGAKFDGVKSKEAPRFLTNLRDLAAYVHVDQLYQAYFNAALLLLGSKVGKDFSKFDVEIPNNSKRANTTRQGFATWGGPHLLDLLASVSSRGLKIVRRQKFQIHRRARPEVLAARLTLAKAKKGSVLGKGQKHVETVLSELEKHCPKLMKAIAQRNISAGTPETRGLVAQKGLPVDPIAGDANLMLPMAFPEGSPMHPAYGAGHATVAGACVTVLKALLHTVKNENQKNEKVQTKVTMAEFGFNNVYQSTAVKGTTDFKLVSTGDTGLTVTDELDKLAANVSIGRNMAGVHFYTDYYESLRLGERIAVGILQEHLQTSPEAISLSFFDFDNRFVEIKKGMGPDNFSHAEIIVDDRNVPTSEWWTENVKEYELQSLTS